MAMLYPFMILLFSAIGATDASQFDAIANITIVKKDDMTGHIYIGDGPTVRVFDVDMTETRTYNLSDDGDTQSKINILEIINRNGSAYIFVCLKNDNLTCYWIDNEAYELSFSGDLEYGLFFTQGNVSNIRDNTISSLACDPSIEYAPDFVYICLAVGYSCHNPNTENVIEVAEISLETKTIALLPRNRTCQLSSPFVYSYQTAASFIYNNSAFFVVHTNNTLATNTCKLSTVILQVRHSYAGHITVVMVPVYSGERFPIPKSASLFRAPNFEDHLVFLRNDKAFYKYMVQHVSMKAVLRYTQLASSRSDTTTPNRNLTTSTFPDILRSTSVLELKMAPWHYQVRSRIDMMKVTTRLGSAIAYHTSMASDYNRSFVRLKLGANSNDNQWKKTVPFGKQRVVGMWEDGRYLIVVGEKEIIKLDTAACTHRIMSICNRDIECAWCGELPGSCTQKDACATPLDIDTLAQLDIKKPIEPNEGFRCGGSVVRVNGQDLDLSNTISVEVHNQKCDVIRDMSSKNQIEVRVPAYNNSANLTTLTVELSDGQQKGFPFTYLKCPHIVEPSGNGVKVIKSGGTKLQVSVKNIDDLNNNYFYLIEVAFLYNNTVVATTLLRHVAKVGIPTFEFYSPPLVDYVGDNLKLALAAPTYHLLDRPNAKTVLYGSVSKLNLNVVDDPVIAGIHVGDETTDIVTVTNDENAGKLFFTGKNMATISEADIHVWIEHVGPCENVSIMRSNNRVSCDLPLANDYFGRYSTCDIIVYIGHNLVYHPGQVRYEKTRKVSKDPVYVRTVPTTTATRTTSKPIIPVRSSRGIDDDSAIRLEVLIPCLLLALGFSGCLVMYYRFRKQQARRESPDRDLPSVVSYRSNPGMVFIGDGRPSFSFQGASVENSSTDAFITENYEESAHLIINTMEDEGLLLKKRDLNIDHLIGRGNFGSVFKGHLCTGDERKDIAVKTLQRDKPENMDITQFLKEAFVMKNFRHANVMTLVGVCLDAGDMPLVVLPYMKHGDLLTYLQEERHIPTVKDLVCFGLDIALGMEYLASLKFVHRDLAARNCMLDVNFRVKVADFGLSRDVYETSYYSTRSKGVKLPVKWMSIESLSGGVFNEKTDVWSYGVTLWELMTRGVRPYAAVDNWDMEAYLKSGRRLPQPIYCPANFYKLMRKCWSAEPEDRPTFAIVKDWISELLNRVHHYLGDMDQTTNIETTYVNLSLGNAYKYENLGNY